MERSVSAFPFPVLSETSLCYVDGVSYEAHIHRRDEEDDITVEHRLRGDSLVAALVNEKRAKFACDVSVPLTMCRRIYPLDGDGEVVAMQRIPCNKGEFSGIPRLRPIVVCAERIPPTLVRDFHGLDAFYSEGHVQFPDGAIVADAGWKKFGGHSGLFWIECSSDVPPGTVRVTESTSDGFYFVVSVHPEDYALMQTPGERENECRGVMINALTDAMSELRNGDLRHEWRDHQSLQALYRDLEAHGVPTWEDDDFRPIYAATTLRPYALSSPEEADDD